MCRTTFRRRGWRAIAVVLVLAWSQSARAACEASGTLPPQLVGQRGCQLTALGITPLTDLGCGTYRGEEGGLYPGGSADPPPAHWLAGTQVGRQVVPLTSTGQPNATTGRIGFASIGMSNTAMEFAAFQALAAQTRGLHRRLVIVNGAQGGETAESWAQATSSAWSVLAQRLAAAGLSPAQLQVVWIKQANREPARLGAFPTHAESLRDDLFDVVRIAKARYPNLRIVYLSSRTRAYTTELASLNPEPFAYESGYAVKWLIAEQLAGNPDLRFAGSGAPAPWLAWGPYLWADGAVPRADGLTWSCSDLMSDFTHPSSAGTQKVAAQLMGFLLYEPSAVPWFRAAPTGCGLLGIEPFVAVALARGVRLARRTGRRDTARLAREEEDS